MAIHQRHWEYIDCLRTVAIIGVVVIHALSNITNTAEEVTWSWQIAAMLNLALRWAVPVFVMISGALLLPMKDESVGIFLRKRMYRLLVPAIVWMGVYFVWFNRGEYSYPLFEYLERVLVWGNPYYHFYFIYLMLGLYLITPGLRILVAHTNIKLLALGSVGMLMLASYWSIVISWFGGTFPRDTLTVVTHFLPYVGYYLLGYVLHVNDWSGYLVKLAWLSVGMWMGAVVLTQLMYGIWGFSSKSMMLEDYASLNVVLLSITVFVLVKYLNSRQLFAHYWWVGSIARSAFGIYLMHLLILEWGVKYFQVTLGLHVWIAISVGGVLAFGISWLVTEVIGSQQWLSKLVGR